VPKTQENKPSETFQRFLMFEGTAVLLATPFLIFPYQFLPATVAALLLIIWLWTRNWRQAGQILPPTPFNGAMLLFGLSTVMGLLVSDTPDVTIPKATGLILGLTLWRFVLVAIHTHRRLIAVTLAYLL
jgi:hypothetical protein